MSCPTTPRRGSNGLAAPDATFRSGPWLCHCPPPDRVVWHPRSRPPTPRGRGTTHLVSPSMRVLVFHGSLLHGTGSNVYNARLCAALARQGHTVDLLSQERHPETLGFIGAYGTWERGEARVSAATGQARGTA